MEEQNRHIIETDLTLESLDEIQRAEAPAFLYTRLMAKMESGQINIWYRAAYLLTRPAVSLTILCILLLINGYILINNLDQKEEGLPQHEYMAQQINYFDNHNPLP